MAIFAQFYTKIISLTFSNHISERDICNMKTPPVPLSVQASSCCQQSLIWNQSQSIRSAGKLSTLITICPSQPGAATSPHSRRSTRQSFKTKFQNGKSFASSRSREKFWCGSSSSRRGWKEESFVMQERGELEHCYGWLLELKLELEQCQGDDTTGQCGHSVRCHLLELRYKYQDIWKYSEYLF